MGRKVARYLPGGRGLRLYADIVRVQDSSLATKRACRVVMSYRAFPEAEPHLTAYQARLLRDGLTRFIEAAHDR